jgi:hypothetical protein
MLRALACLPDGLDPSAAGSIAARPILVDGMWDRDVGHCLDRAERCFSGVFEGFWKGSERLDGRGEVLLGRRTVYSPHFGMVAESLARDWWKCRVCACGRSIWSGLRSTIDGHLVVVMLEDRAHSWECRGLPSLTACQVMPHSCSYFLFGRRSHLDTTQ